MNDIPVYEELKIEDDIRQFMDEQIACMGDNLVGFEITWCQTKTTIDLVIGSVGKPLTRDEARVGLKEQDFIKRFGRSITVGYIKDPDGIYLDVIQKEGRRLYYGLRKDYPNIHRNLGR